MAEPWTLEGVYTFLGGVADIAERGVDVYATVRDRIESVDEETDQVVRSLANGYRPTYDPNLSWQDFSVSPNFKLLAFGVVLLIVALILNLLK